LIPIFHSLLDTLVHHTLLSQNDYSDEYGKSSLRSFDYIYPFACVVVSPHASSSITGAALSSLHKFLLYGFLRKEEESQRACEGIELIGEAIIQCKFEEVGMNEGEVVLMKMLELSALCIRCEVGNLLSEELIFKIFMVCYEVAISSLEFQQEGSSKTASALLSSTAGNTLAHIVLVLFNRSKNESLLLESNVKDDEVLDWGGSDDDDDEVGDGNDTGNESVSDEEDADSARPLQQATNTEKQLAIVRIMDHLSKLTNPRQYNHHFCGLALSLINIALETGTTHLKHYKYIVPIMQGDLCKHLLQLSQSSELTILSLTLRVVFNLFCSMKDHLKVQLEVFLTSVHLRILSPNANYSPEQRELALESLLEFCQEPALMQDLYTNYDCDFQCTNLFETICSTLSDQAKVRPGKSLNALNRLSLNGLLAVIDSIFRRCFIESRRNEGENESGDVNDSKRIKRPAVDVVSPQPSPTLGSSRGAGIINLDDSANSDESTGRGAREKTAQILQERKRKKHLFELASKEFNKAPMKQGWIQYAIEIKLLPSDALTNAGAIAEFLYSTPNIDKTQLGLYLSRGPADKYPFNDEVLQHYTNLFDFSDLGFAQSLRLYLLRFRLPGEAQCIDRLMESFSSHPQIYNPPFKSSDAVFILSFSTIMLNTDLHNPQIRPEKKMTAVQFLRNNRGINEGEDLPEDFLLDLYEQIRGEEIQVQASITDVMDLDSQGMLKWDDTVLKKSEEVADASFTDSGEARRGGVRAGLHEKDMFTSIASLSLDSIKCLFEMSPSDTVVINCLAGFRQFSHITVFFNMKNDFNSLLVFLLKHGYEYIGRYQTEPDLFSNLQSTSLIDGLVAGIGVSISYSTSGSNDLLRGCAYHRGLLSLHLGFHLLRDNVGMVDARSWPLFAECFFGLRELDALPKVFDEVEDFDQEKSVFGLRCEERRVRRGRRGGGGRERGGGGKGWLQSIFGAGDDTDSGINGINSSHSHNDSNNKSNANSSNQLETDDSFAGSLRLLITSVNLAKIFPLTTNLPPKTLASLTSSLLSTTAITGPHSKPSSPNFEDRASLTLDLALKVLFSNIATREPRHTAQAYSHIDKHVKDILRDENIKKKATYLTERAIITVLKACVHLLDCDFRAAGSKSEGNNRDGQQEQHEQQRLQEEQEGEENQTKEGQLRRKDGDGGIREMLMDSLGIIVGVEDEILRHISSRVAVGCGTILRCSTGSSWSFSTLAELIDHILRFPRARPILWPVISDVALTSPAVAGGREVADRRRLVDILCNLSRGKYEGDMTYARNAAEVLVKVVAMMIVYDERDSCSDDNKDNNDDDDDDDDNSNDHVNINININININRASAVENLFRSVVSCLHASCLSSRDIEARLHCAGAVVRILVSAAEGDKVGKLGFNSWVWVFDEVLLKMPPVGVRAGEMEGIRGVGETLGVRIKLTEGLSNCLLRKVVSLSKGGVTRGQEVKRILLGVSRITAENVSIGGAHGSGGTGFLSRGGKEEGGREELETLFDASMQSAANLVNVLEVLDRECGSLGLGRVLRQALRGDLVRAGANDLVECFKDSGSDEGAGREGREAKEGANQSENPMLQGNQQQMEKLEKPHVQQLAPQQLQPEQTLLEEYRKHQKQLQYQNHLQQVPIIPCASDVFEC